MSRPKKQQSERRIDRTDRRILSLIQADAHLSNKEVAKKVNLSPTPCLRRIGLLEQAGYIRRYKAVLDPAKLGYGIRAFLTIKRSRNKYAGTRDGELMLIHRCTICAKLAINRIAG